MRVCACVCKCKRSDSWIIELATIPALLKRFANGKKKCSENKNRSKVCQTGSNRHLTEASENCLIFLDTEEMFKRI